MLARFPRLRLLLSLFVVYFVALLLLRVGFYLYFLKDSGAPADQLWQAFGIGARFDLRLALLMALPLGVISLLPSVFGLRGAFGKGLGLVVNTGIVGLAAFTYIVDFGYYSYLGERLSAAILRFFQDGKDTYQMVWESYPVVWLVLLLVVVCVLTWLGTRYLIERFRRDTSTPAVWWRFALMVPVVLAIYFYGFVGKVTSVVPLRWSDAFFSDNPKVVALALNPANFFVSTLHNASKPYDPKKLAANYMQVAEYLGVDHPDVKTLNFVRKVAGYPHQGRLPNIVFIHMESLGANRQSFYGNPMQATPHLEAIEKRAIFFPNFFVPASGTARTVFGLITGIPDVTWGGSTATRNALISQQYTLVNSFKGYKKLYFIGGDAGWANVQGLLQHSIPDLELWQEKDYHKPAADVWGISDHNLMVAANNRLNSLPKDQPFVAFIQLANNHRPFAMPEDDAKVIGFKWRDVPLATLHKYAFTDLRQYNAVRFQDDNINYYLNTMVPASNYANDTIFFMYGDHNTGSHEPSALTNYSEPLGINHQHVPFVIFGPGIIKTPEVRTQVGTLMDIMPTALGFTGLPYENRTLGRDLIHWKGPGYALTFGGDRVNDPSIGLVSSTDYLRELYSGKDPHFFEIAAPKVDVIAKYPDVVKQREGLLMGLFQSATYLLTHNSPPVDNPPSK